MFRSWKTLLASDVEHLQVLLFNFIGEWTQISTRYLREQLVKISDFYHMASSTGDGPVPVPPEVEQAMKQWEYNEKLAFHMFQEGMLEKHEYLTWILDVLEKIRPVDDNLLKLLLPLMLQYSDEFVQSAYLSRRLAYFCARRLSLLLSDSPNLLAAHSPHMIIGANNTSIGTPSPGTPGPGMSPMQLAFSDFLSCAQHGPLVYGLSCMLQVRARIYEVEQQIKQRGRAVEVRWSFDKCQESTAGEQMSQYDSQLTEGRCGVLVPKDGNFPSLYWMKGFRNTKLFTCRCELSEVAPNDEAVVTLLCEWAVSCKRSGKHRAMAVAKLLEKRQAEIEAERCGDSEVLDEKESISSASLAGSSLPVFQNVLLRFLDTQAPSLSDPNSECEKVEFVNLVLLFCEFIRHDVFSHDAYMCTLISRGDLSVSASAGLRSPVGENADEHYSKDHDMKMEIFSPMPGESCENAHPSLSRGMSVNGEKLLKREKPRELIFPSNYDLLRHLQYATHFPIPLYAYLPPCLTCVCTGSGEDLLRAGATCTVDCRFLLIGQVFRFESEVKNITFIKQIYVEFPECLRNQTAKNLGFSGSGVLSVTKSDITLQNVKSFLSENGTLSSNKTPL
ncbi:mediator of RNA polymerase II transcription subunit 12-like protein [Cricetulus griseus]|nr:mediator of RNA polymerase II transcription subunit 12-like protein [Cricetulus griseus]